MSKPNRVYMSRDGGKRNRDGLLTFRFVVPFAADGHGNTVTMVGAYQATSRLTATSRLVKTYLDAGHDAPDITDRLAGLFN